MKLRGNLFCLLLILQQAGFAQEVIHAPAPPAAHQESPPTEPPATPSSEAAGDQSAGSGESSQTKEQSGHEPSPNDCRVANAIIKAGGLVAEKIGELTQVEAAKKASQPPAANQPAWRHAAYLMKVRGYDQRTCQLNGEIRALYARMKAAENELGRHQWRLDKHGRLIHDLQIWQWKAGTRIARTERFTLREYHYFCQKFGKEYVDYINRTSDDVEPASAGTSEKNQASGAGATEGNAAGDQSTTTSTQSPVTAPPAAAQPAPTTTTPPATTQPPATTTTTTTPPAKTEADGSGASKTPPDDGKAATPSDKADGQDKGAKEEEKKPAKKGWLDFLLYNGWTILWSVLVFAAALWLAYAIFGLSWRFGAATAVLLVILWIVLHNITTMPSLASP